MERLALKELLPQIFQHNLTDTTMRPHETCGNSCFWVAVNKQNTKSSAVQEHLQVGQQIKVGWKTFPQSCCCCFVTRSCPALCDPMDCSLPGSSLHGIFQARILEWLAIPFSRGPPWARDQTHALLHCKQILYHLSYFVKWYKIHELCSHPNTPRTNLVSKAKLC